MQGAGRKLHAQFVLHGNIERQGDQLLIALEFTDAQTGKRLWADNFVRPVGELAAVREETAAHVARVLHLPAGAPVPASPINLEAYQLYVRGQKLMSNLRQADAEQAAALFQRATVLDPGFARAYLASGQALLLADRPSRRRHPSWKPVSKSDTSAHCNSIRPSGRCGLNVRACCKTRIAPRSCIARVSRCPRITGWATCAMRNC